MNKTARFVRIMPRSFLRVTWLLAWIGFGVCATSCLPNCQPGNDKPSKGKNDTKAPSSPESNLEASASTAKTNAKFQKNWFESSWISQIYQQPKAVPSFFSQDEGRRADIAALWENRWHEALKRSVKSTEIQPGHRIVRTRLHLRLARFYDASYRFATKMNLLRLRGRLGRAGKIKLGQMFYFYYGRQLCASGFFKDAQAAFEKALNTASAASKPRVTLWQKACVEAALTAPASLAEPLGQVSLDGDSEAQTELLLLQHFFKIPVSAKVREGKSERAKMLWGLLQAGKDAENSDALRGIAETETIVENIQGSEISASLEFFDPLVLWALKVFHGKKALEFLQQAPASDLYAPFYRARAYTFAEQPKEAMAAYEAFLKQPPTQVDWSYLLFSRRWSPQTLQDEARYRMIMLSAKSDFKGAKKKLEAMAKSSWPMMGLASLGILQLTDSKEKKLRTESYASLIAGARIATELTKKWFVQYTKASELKAPGQASAEEKALAQQKISAANAITKWNLHRYATQPFLLWASEGALRFGDVERAVRWMESLHRKDNPYQLGGANEAHQFVLSARAYMRAGKMGIATLFFAKAKQDYPALTQLWSLLNILRIYRGTEGGSELIVGPKGG